MRSHLRRFAAPVATLTSASRKPQPTDDRRPSFLLLTGHREPFFQFDATDSSASEHRLADNRLRGDRILKGDRALQLVVGVERVDDAKH